MSVLIKGMQMPNVCDGCWALDESGDYPMCRITGETRGYNFRVREKRMDRCPLIELPEADEFAEEMRSASVRHDEEIAHIHMDDAMCELLEKLGYEKAVKVFEDTEKWYS